MPLEVLMAGKAGLADLALERLIALSIRAGDSNGHLVSYYGAARQCRLFSLQSMLRNRKRSSPLQL